MKYTEMTNILEILKEKFDITPFQYVNIDGDIEYIITIKPKQNKYSNVSSNLLKKEEFEIIKNYFATSEND